jgi:uncharacterized protein
MIQVVFQSTYAHSLNDCRLPGVIPVLHSSIFHDCRAPQLPPAPLSPNLPALRPHPLLRKLTLDNEYIVAYVPSFSQVALLNAEAQALLARLPLQDVPGDGATTEALLVLHRIGLLTDDVGTVPPPPEPDVLVAWLHVTSACNLRCRYCYINKTSATMSATTARSAIDAVMRSARQHGYRKIALKYAGGEAALHMPLVEQMQTYALAQAAEHGFHLEAGLLSNGTCLSPPQLAVIRRLGLRLMLSLDGLAETHDAQRPTLTGQGSFAATLAGIEHALAAGIRPDIAITVTSQSIAGLPALLGWLLERELPFTISFYRPHNQDSSSAQLHYDEQQLIAGMRAAYAAIAQMPPRWSLLGALLDRVDLSLPHARTCAVGRNYLVIDPHGRIAKCQMTLDQPVTAVDANDPLTQLRLDQAGVQNLPVNQKDGCRECDWRYWCAGGCAVATYHATGRYDSPAPDCRIYRSLYPDLLRLEGHRLRHWQRMAQAHHTSSSVSSE